MILKKCEIIQINWNKEQIYLNCQQKSDKCWWSNRSTKKSKQSLSQYICVSVWTFNSCQTKYTNIRIYTKSSTLYQYCTFILLVDQIEVYLHISVLMLSISPCLIFFDLYGDFWEVINHCNLFLWWQNINLYKELERFNVWLEPYICNTIEVTNNIQTLRIGELEIFIKKAGVSRRIGHYGYIFVSTEENTHQ